MIHVSRISLWLASLLPATLLAQHTKLTVVPTWTQGRLVLDSAYADLGDTVQVTTVRLYVGELRAATAGGDTLAASSPYLLVDARDTAGTYVTFRTAAPLASVAGVIGVNSALNFAGPQAGALDVANGMYWTWQSGYIGLKLEGMSTACPEGFTYHVGGFLGGLSPTAEFTALASAPSLTRDAVGRAYQLKIDVRALHAALAEHVGCTLMRPHPSAVLASRRFSGAVSLISPAAAP